MAEVSSRLLPDLLLGCWPLVLKTCSNPSSNAPWSKDQESCQIQVSEAISSTCRGDLQLHVKAQYLLPPDWPSNPSSTLDTRSVSGHPCMGKFFSFQSIIIHILDVYSFSFFGSKGQHIFEHTPVHQQGRLASGQKGSITQGSCTATAGSANTTVKVFVFYWFLETSTEYLWADNIFNLHSPSQPHKHMAQSGCSISDSPAIAPQYLTSYPFHQHHSPPMHAVAKPNSIEQEPSTFLFPKFKDKNHHSQWWKMHQIHGRRCWPSTHNFICEQPSSAQQDVGRHLRILGQSFSPHNQRSPHPHCLLEGSICLIENWWFIMETRTLEANANGR